MLAQRQLLPSPRLTNGLLAGCSQILVPVVLEGRPWGELDAGRTD
ncbi:hypothetical protein [Thermogemmatispora carboxidivorans]|nr:hypothetical protein [Thermogemmatispora carboxidivorans]